MTIATVSEQHLRFRAGHSRGEVSAILLRPPSPSAFCLYILGPGAGAGMRHRFLAAIAAELAHNGVATFRYQFPYMERGGRRPDTKPILLETIRSAVAAAGAACPELPLIAGGKSMGGRMTSLAAAETPLSGVRGLAFIGFPLHGAGKPPSAARADHLSAVSVPMLFLQGTRDKLADIALMSGVCAGLGSGVTLRKIEGADHGFHVLKRSGRSDEEVIVELARAIAQWSTPLQTSVP